MITHGNIGTFQDRLTRIESGKTTAWTEPGGGLASIRGGKRVARGMERKKQSVLTNLNYPATFVWATVLGACAVVISRYVRYNMLGMDLGDGSDADLSYLMDVGMGAAVGFVLTMLLQLDGKQYKLAQMAGVVAMVGLMHNIVWYYPEQVALAFGPDYVDMVKQSTQPDSFLFRGDTFVW